jgi:hypothetical protein
MRILLDTHVFLWYISADAQLPAGSVHQAACGSLLAGVRCRDSR